MNKIKFLFKSIVYLSLLGFCLVIGVIIYYGKSLPNYKFLENYEPPITSRLYSKDGFLIDEFAKEKRSFVAIKFMPEHIKEAFLSAEDSNFYHHPGVDLKSIIRAAYQNIFRLQEGKSVIGASTITQQVVKNLLLTKERTLARKIKEAILSIRISKVLSKERVLELYLNQIYLGYRSYGVASAALNYFNKPLDQLTIAEAAFLAALPKAPGRLDPKKNYQKAIGRRNWVLKQMNLAQHITQEQYEVARNTPILTQAKEINNTPSGAFSEQVRKEISSQFDEKILDEKGLVVHGTLNQKYQDIAFSSLRRGLQRYERRQAYKGAISNIKISQDEINSVILKNPNIKEIDDVEFDLFEQEWFKEFLELSAGSELRYEKWKLAMVLSVDEEESFAKIILKDGKVGKIYHKHIKWLKKTIVKENLKVAEDEEFLVPYKDIKNIFKVGDVILVVKKFNKEEKNLFVLRLAPKVSGAMVIMNPNSGAILAMVGGYTDDKTEFNRAIQAKRQPGSILKPFTYLTALENNILPTTIIIDDEVKMKKEDGSYWIPQNYSKKFYGPTPIRMGLEKSRNVVTIRLAELVGLHKIAKNIKKLEIIKEPVSNFSLVLGADESTLLNITRAYAIIANGGNVIEPYFIERIQDKTGKTLLKHKKIFCEFCNVEEGDAEIQIPQFIEKKEQLLDKRSTYQLISMLKGVVQRGTAWRARRLIQPIAGKTGTTNDNIDTWFVGFSPDLVIGVWVGFDEPKTLGKYSTGSSIAVPIFIDAMSKIQKRLKFQARTFKVPKDIKFSRIDRNTGKAPNTDSLKKDIIFEVFKSENLKKFYQNEQKNLGDGDSDDDNLY